MSQIDNSRISPCCVVLLSCYSDKGFFSFCIKWWMTVFTNLTSFLNDVLCHFRGVQRSDRHLHRNWSHLEQSNSPRISAFVTGYIKSLQTFLHHTTVTFDFFGQLFAVFFYYTTIKNLITPEEVSFLLKTLPVILNFT